jgi:hypothetical protein
MGVWFPNRDDIHHFICNIDSDTTTAKIEATLSLNFEVFLTRWHYGLTTCICQLCFHFEDGVQPEL